MKKNTKNQKKYEKQKKAKNQMNERKYGSLKWISDKNLKI